MALYLAAGALGLPVFAGTPEKGIGLVYMLGGTGGYLLGFLLAAAACGWLAERGWDRNVVGTALAMLVGNGIDILTKIDMIAGDFEVKTGMCGKDGQHVPVGTGQATLRISEMTVGGTD